MNNIINLRNNKNNKLLKEFIKLYNETFTNIDERDNPNEWKDRLYNIKNTNSNKLYNTNLQSINNSRYFNTLHILLNIDENNKVIGGIVYEYYNNSNCALITYLVVDKKYRHKGIGTKLLNNAIINLKHEYLNLNDIFTEANKDNVQFFNKLNFDVLNIPYIQPSLDISKKPCKHLKLLRYKNIFNTYKFNTVNFLYEYYKVHNINNPEQNVDYVNMCKQIIS